MKTHLTTNNRRALIKTGQAMSMVFLFPCLVLLMDQAPMWVLRTIFFVIVLGGFAYGLFKEFQKENTP